MAIKTAETSAGVKAGRNKLKSAEILLIEEDPLSRILFEDLLNCVAGSVYAAADSAQALEVLKIVRPDLIVIDVVDHRLSGLVAVKQLATGAEKKIPVVVVSGLPADVHKQAMMDAGCSAYIAKPASAATFVNTIRHLLESHDRGRKATSRLAHYLDIDLSRPARTS